MANTVDKQQKIDDPYRGYAGLPPLAGVHSMEEVLTKGLTVAESVERLKRIRWALKRLHGLFVFPIAAMPIYELKMAFSLHAHYCAEHVGEFAARIREMRQPPYGLEFSPSSAIDLLFDEIQAAPSSPVLILGLYEYAVPSLVRVLKRFMADTNRLFDHPSYRICRLTLLELEDIQEYGEQAVGCLVTEELRAELFAWTCLLEKMIEAAGDLDGTQALGEEPVHGLFCAVPKPYDGVVQRDERFKDLYNMGVNAEAMLLDPNVPPLPKTVMLYFKRMREIDVPEMMSSILVQTEGKPWEYYRDLTRQLWDEARHAMMGEIGFASLGIDWTEIPLNYTWSLALNTKLTPKERHAVLFTIEQGLMPKNVGKEYEWRIALATEDPLTAFIQDYDWADEILHARIGREWIVPELGSQAEAQAFGDQAWSRVLVDWKAWREQGLTEHRNWWPDVYRAACKHWKVEPDPALLAYSTTYENVRADLKTVNG